jgi:hypothetical protein
MQVAVGFQEMLLQKQEREADIDLVLSTLQKSSYRLQQARGIDGRIAFTTRFQISSSARSVAAMVCMFCNLSDE